MNDTLLSHHEAAHAVVGALFGMRPAAATLQPQNTMLAHVRSEQEGLVDSFPGEEVQRLLIWACVRVIHLAAGGCAELRLGNRHEDCGWAGDMKQFEPLTFAISRLTGRSYDECWWTLSGAAENLLAKDGLWSVVQLLADRLIEARELSADDIALVIDTPLQSLATPTRESVIRELSAWVDTTTSRALAADPEVIASLASG